MIETLNKSKIKKITYRYFKLLIFLFGTIFITFVIFSFTNLPYYGYYYLGKENSTILDSPDYIIILSGNGMPSPDGLIKAYYASIAARQYKNARIIVSMPFNEGEDSLREAQFMEKELIIRGIDSNRIILNPKGYNTYTQAKSITDKLWNIKQKTDLLIITSPEHMYRSIHTFLKLGFKGVYGMSTFEKPIDENKLKNNEKNELRSLSFRYNMWSYMNYELIVLREYLAIGYYKIHGWI